MAALRAPVHAHVERARTRLQPTYHRLFAVTAQSARTTRTESMAELLAEASQDADENAAPSYKRVPAAAPGRRTQVRRSGVHGKGLFALRAFRAGETIMEYIGEIISWKEALRRHPHDPSDPNHTFYFHIDDEHVIDGAHGGNSARWINHSCDGNCEADERDGRVFIVARRRIKVGDELSYDYGLVIDQRYTPKLKAEYPCWCGSKNCRGTLLAPKKR